MADELTFDMGRLEKISNAVRWPNAVKICFWMIFGKRVRLGVREMAFFAVSLSKKQPYEIGSIAIFFHK